MSRDHAPRAVVCVLVAAGRGVAARPAFEAGLPVALGPKSRGGAAIGDLVRVRLKGAGGHVVERLGRADVARDAMRALLVEEGVWRDFPADVRSAADAAADREAEVDPERRDMRDQRVITIDPEGAKDHDDAIAVRSDGPAIRLWVHIADVSRFVPAGGAVDREAAWRGTSVYLPGTVVPMLPARLSNDVCSLRPGVDRKVVTAEILVGADGEVTENSFFRSLIRSERRLTYPQVDALFAGGALDAHGPGDEGLEEDLRLARDLAERLRARRLARGALEIASAEPSFRFDDHGRVVGAWREGQTPAHSLVEECMIAANEAVARELIARGRPTVFRIHTTPDERSVERLYERLEALGVGLPPLPEGPLTPEQCQEAARAASVAVRGSPRAVSGLVLRALQRAYYDIGPPGHSGLASPAYVHFTSPIRRYPDLVVHRGLLAALGLSDEAPGTVEVAVASADSSEREERAQDLERRGDRVCLALLLADRLRSDRDAVFDAEVTGLVPGGAFCDLGELFEGFLPARTLGEEGWTLDATETRLVSPTGARLVLGGRLRVRVREIDALRGRVTLDLADASVREVARHEGRGGARGRGKRSPRIVRRGPRR